MIRDLENQLGAAVVSIQAGTKTTDGNGTAADLRNYKKALIVAQVGQSGDTLSSSVYWELEVEHSHDGSTWADCADADLQTSVAGSNTGTFAKIDSSTKDRTVYMTTYVGSRRYVRAVVNATGTHTNGTPIGVAIVPFGYAQLPV